MKSHRFEKSLINRLNHAGEQIEKQLNEVFDLAESFDEKAYADLCYARLRLIEAHLLSRLPEPPRLIHADDLKFLPEASDDRTATR